VNLNEIKKSTVEDIAKELFALTLTMKGSERDQLECILQTLVNILRDRQTPQIR